jgi:hypothetical protein
MGQKYSEHNPRLTSLQKIKASFVRLPAQTILRQGSAMETGGPVSKKMEESFEKPHVVRLGKIGPIDFLLCGRTYNKRICCGKCGNQLQIGGSQPQKSRLRPNRNSVVATPIFGAELSTSSTIAIVIS